MTHLDEGTIHAWLDGALPAAEARAAEAHVAGCAECSARVAEARGLIAGASRILTALDDVPAGVSPAGAMVRSSLARQWRAAPWVMGIAAAMLLAVGITTWRRTARVTVAERAEPVAQATAVPTVPAADSIVGGAARVVAVSAPPRVDQATPRGPRTAPGGSGGAGAGARAAAGIAAAAPGGEASPSAKLAAAEPATRDSMAGGRGAKDVVDAMKDERKLGVDAPPPAAPQPEIDAMKRVGVAGGLTALAAPVGVPGEARGCYRLASAFAIRTSDTVRQAARPAVSQRRVPLGAAEARAPQRAPTMGVLPEAPAVVWLDSAAHPRGFVARDAQTRLSVGWWFRVPGDSIHMDLQAAGRFTVPASARTTCPRP